MSDLVEDRLDVQPVRVSQRRVGAWLRRGRDVLVLSRLSWMVAEPCLSVSVKKLSKTTRIWTDQSASLAPLPDLALLEPSTLLSDPTPIEQDPLGTRFLGEALRSPACEVTIPRDPLLARRLGRRLGRVRARGDVRRHDRVGLDGEDGELWRRGGEREGDDDWGREDELL